MRKILICSVILVLLSSFVFGEDLSDLEKSQINELQQLRMEIKAYDSVADAVKKVDAFQENLLASPVYNELGEEAKLLLESIIIWERYNWLYELDPKSKDLEKIMVDLHKKLKDWIETKEEVSPWGYCVVADITSSTLQYLSMGDAMKEGLNVKKYYEEALEEDDDMCWVFMNLAQWYFHAPGFAGGGKKKALTYFEKAAEEAETTPEKFFALLFLSQGLFENNRKDECKAVLSEIEEIVPGSSYVDFVKNLNAADFSLYYYIVNREKVEKELNKQ